MGTQRGFTLLETLVAAAVATAIGFFLLGAIAGALKWSAMLGERERAESAVAALTDRLQAEEDSAWSIFTPPSDVLGQDNSDYHELDFFTRDAHSRAYFWAYRYDRAAHNLQRYLYSTPGSAPVADGAHISGISNFIAQTLPVTALQDTSNPLYSPLFTNAALHPATVHFGFADRPWIAGGNQLTRVRIESLQSVHELVLSTQTAPSGFTVVLQYTPSPSPVPAAPKTLTAMIEKSSVRGTWRSCSNPRAGCSNADWPQYFWTQTTVYRYYQSIDAGLSWTLTSSDQQTSSGISTPTGGDTPSVDCGYGVGLDYLYECSTNWSPAPPPGTAGMDFSAP